jgi:hypothetical protein
MGATGWRYYVRHQSDVNAALQELRQGVFERREYEQPMSEEEAEAVMKNASPRMQMLYDLAKRLEKSDPPRPKVTHPPQTIDELIERCAESGTHSILDVDRISAAPDFGALTPLTQQQLIAFFGTTRPTRAMVERWQKRIQPLTEPNLYERWQGIYLTVYKDGAPDELYIEGASGD